MQRLDTWRRIDFGHLDNKHIHTRRQLAVRRRRTAQRHVAKPQREARLALAAAGLRRQYNRLAMPLGPGVHGRKQPFAIDKQTVLRRAGRQLDTARATGELLVDVALAVGDHGDASRLSQHIGGLFGRKQPAIGFLVLDRASAGSLDLGPGAIENLCAHQSNDTAMNRIDRNGRVQKQAEITIVSGSPEATFAVGVAGEVEFRGVLDRQHVPSGRALAGESSSGGEHFAIADRAMIEKAAKGQFLVTVIRQHMDAGGRLLTHRIEQFRANPAKTRIAKTPKIILQHRIGPYSMFDATESQFTPQGNRFALARTP